MTSLYARHLNLTPRKPPYHWEPTFYCDRFIYLKNKPPGDVSTSFQLPEWERTLILALRIVTLKLLVVLLSLHVKAFRVFLWEQTISAGIFVTYLLAIVGIALCTGSGRCESQLLQIYLLSSGSILLITNCVGMFIRWRRTSALSSTLIELLAALGVPIRRYIIIKICFSALAALCMFIDLVLIVAVFDLKSKTNSTAGAGSDSDDTD